MNTAPPPQSSPHSPCPGRGSAPGLMLGLGVGALGLLAVVFLFPPDQYRFYPHCLFFDLTGWQCAGCGGLRAMHHLLHGHFRTAFALHPLLVASLPLLLVGAARAGWVHRTTGRWTGPLQRPVWVWLIVAVLLLFSIGRNLLPAIL